MVYELHCCFGLVITCVTCFTRVALHQQVEFGVRKCNSIQTTVCTRDKNH